MRPALLRLFRAPASGLQRRLDGRTGVLAVVCTIFAFASMLLALDAPIVKASAQTRFMIGSVVVATMACWCLARGRLRDAECAAALLLIVVVGTLQALAFTSTTLRWATVFGLAGVPLITLTITKVRWAVLVTAVCLFCQCAIVLSNTEAALDRIVTLAILMGDMPLFVGYTAVLLRRTERLRRLAEHAANHDQLTGLLNRRGLWNGVLALVATAGPRQSHIGVLTVDLDHFKRVNDAFGHDAGDALLAAVGAHLQSVVQGVDLAVRIGGEELAVVGCFADQETAIESAERLRLGIESLRIDGVPPITASIGVATSFGDDVVGEPRDVVARLFVLADRALYQAKNAGRNQVQLFGQEATALLAP